MGNQILVPSHGDGNDESGDGGNYSYGAGSGTGCEPSNETGGSRRLPPKNPSCKTSFTVLDPDSKEVAYDSGSAELLIKMQIILSRKTDWYSQLGIAHYINSLLFRACSSAFLFVLLLNRYC